MSNLAKTVEDFDYRATKVWFEQDKICAHLVDGRIVQVPLDFYPTLKDASRSQRENFELFGEGTAIYFRSLDEYLSVNAIVLGIKEKI